MTARALFHTPPAVARALLSLVDADPRSILDLASGAGGLWSHALERWPDSVLTTVDEDPGASRPPPPHAHHEADALDWRPPDRTGYDMVTCNPPFMRTGRYARRPHGGPTGAHGVEAAFARRCLSLACRGGTVAMVLPDGLVTGRLAEGFRTALLADHSVAHVAEVPARTFKGTEARTYLVVAIAGTGPSRVVRLHGQAPRDCAGTFLDVDPAAAARRMDHGFHAVVPAAGTTLSDLGALVARGALPRAAAAAMGGPVFHVDDFPDDGRPHVAGLRGDGIPYPSAAVPGDILVARLGRGAHLKVCGLEGGPTSLTDAVFRVRLPPRWRDRALAALVSAEGRARLAATARGVGMRMLGQADLAAMPLPGDWGDAPGPRRGGTRGGAT